MYEFIWYQNREKRTEIVREINKEEKWKELNKLVQQGKITLPFCKHVVNNYIKEEA